MQPLDQNAENGMPLKIMALLLPGICHAEAEMFGRGSGCPLPDTQLLTDQGLRRDIVDVLVLPDTICSMPRSFCFQPACAQTPARALAPHPGPFHQWQSGLVRRLIRVQASHSVPYGRIQHIFP